MKKILLINAPVSIYVNKTAFVPLSLLVLGTCLKKIKQDGVDISYELLDLDFLIKKDLLPDDESFFRKASHLILEKEPDILMFTVHGPNHVLVLKLAEQIKKQKSCLIIVGGVGPTLTAKDALERCKDIDIIVKGEGETVLEPLVQATVTTGSFADVPSIVYRENGQIIENKRRFLAADEPIPAPDYSLVQIEDYIAHNKTHPYIHPGFVLIESGRGCTHGCSFCAPAKMWGRNVRYRPVPEIIAEMEFLAEKGGNFSFFTQDNLDEHFLRELSAALIERDSKIAWGCYSRLDRLSIDMAELLSKAGCKIIFTGLETPNRSAQKKIHKVIDADSTFAKLKIFNQQGIRLIGSFIAGFSGETDAELENTMRFAIECAVGRSLADLERFVSATPADQLPQKPDNICVIHPLAHMAGTEAFYEEFDNLHISRYSAHPDCYGSYLFGYEHFKDDWSLLGINPYFSQLSEREAAYYCSILRLFNLLNSRPYFFTLLMQARNLRPLALLKEMVAQLGEEFVLSAKVDKFEQKSLEYIQQYLDFVPKWTVKKGQ